jgi:hypothetical protein
LGALVTGAVKVEEGVDRLKRNVRAITEETRSRAGARLKLTWTHVRGSVESPRVKPIIGRMKPLADQLERDTEILLDKGEFRAKIVLTRIIDGTIDELEKVKRRLDHDSQRGWHAA